MEARENQMPHQVCMEGPGCWVDGAPLRGSWGLKFGALGGGVGSHLGHCEKQRNSRGFTESSTDWIP